MLFKPVGHHRDACALDFLDLISENHFALIFLHHEREATASFCAENAAVGSAFVGENRVGEVLGVDSCAGVEDRSEQSLGAPIG